MKYKNHHLLRILALIGFVLYLAVLFYVVFFAEQLGRTGADYGYRYNLVLFSEIKRFWNYRSLLGGQAVFLNLGGNIAAFIPFGFIYPMLHRRSRRFTGMVCRAFLLSLMIESVQLVTKVGSFDVDDLLLNTVGGIIGYLIFWALNHWRINH